MLPYDYARCRPTLPAGQCDGCARYANHPDQTWGERTPVISVFGPMDRACEHIPIDREDDK